MASCLASFLGFEVLLSFRLGCHSDFQFGVQFNCLLFFILAHYANYFEIMSIQSFKLVAAKIVGFASSTRTEPWSRGSASKATKTWFANQVLMQSAGRNPSAAVGKDLLTELCYPARYWWTGFPSFSCGPQTQFGTHFWPGLAYRNCLRRSLELLAAECWWSVGYSMGGCSG